MRFITLFLVLLFNDSLVQAQVYKCIVNGNTVFSDKVCADDAESVQLNVRHPSKQEVATQQKTTKVYKEQAKINKIESLRQKNDSLRDKAKLLEQEKQAKLQQLSKGIYRESDSRIATREHGLFERMARLERAYQVKINKVHTEIKQNEDRIEDLL